MRQGHFWRGDFIKSLTLSCNIQKCEFCATNLIIDNYYNFLETQKYGFGVARPMFAYFQFSNKGQFYVGALQGQVPPSDSLVVPPDSKAS